MPWESSSREAEQPGHGWSQSGPYITCWAISWRVPPKRSASVTGPSAPSNTYSWSMATMGSLRRSALSASRERVYSFSLASSCRRASSHCSRDTTSGRLITKPPGTGWNCLFGGTTNGRAGNDRAPLYDLRSSKLTLAQLVRDDQRGGGGGSGGAEVSAPALVAPERVEVPGDPGMDELARI